MNKDKMQNWNPKANAIFLDAIELEDEQARLNLIQRACHGQPELEAEVRALLASYEQSSEFLEASKIDTKDSGELLSETLGAVASQTSFPYSTGDNVSGIIQGTMLDRYRIEQVLGSGGMGVVYLAEDTRLNRRVAIKIPRREFHSDSDKRLEREARTMASVKHSNLASLLDVAEWNGIKYLLMEYVEGQSLDESVREHAAIDQRTIARWLCKLSSAAACAHEAGVVHRDIKPSNVILRPDGEPILMDFGLAYSDSEDARLTKTGAIMGTPAYMAPEQLNGAQHLVGPASDIYALGAIGYELLAGRAVYEGSTSKVLADLADGTPIPAPSTIRRNVDRTLESIILKAIARDPQDRFESAKLMSLALKAYLDNDLAKVRQLVQSGPKRNNPARRSLLIAAAFFSLLLMGSVFIIQTKDGEFVLTTDDPAIATRIADSGGITVENKQTKTEYTLKIGKNLLPNGQYDLVVSSPDGLEISTPQFQLKRLDGKVSASVIARPKRDSMAASDVKVKPPISERVPNYDEAISELYANLPEDLKNHPLLSPKFKWSEPECLGRAIYPEGPVHEYCLTRDEMHMVFRHDMKVMVASRTALDQPFVEPQPLATDEYHIFPSVSNDLLKLSYCSAAGLEGGKGGFDIWQRTRPNTSEPWSKWSLPFPEICTEENEGQSWLSASGLELYFCSSRQGSLGSDDLWVAKRDAIDLTFDTPVRLHEDMNSKGQDFSPSLCADDRILLFCSTRPGGKGYMDIYMSVRNSRADSFTLPIRFGDEINGEFSEGRPIWSADNKTLYFDTNRPGGHRSSDVWCIRRIPRD